MKDKIFFHNDLLSWNKTPEGNEIKQDFANYMSLGGFENSKLGYNTVSVSNDNVSVKATIKPVIVWANIRPDNMVMELNITPNNKIYGAKQEIELAKTLASNYIESTF